MKILPTYFTIALIALLISCKGSKDYTEYSKEIASEKLGEEVTCTSSEDEKFTLCVKSQTDEAGSGMGVVFFVLNNQTKEIVLEDSIDKGTVAWYDESKISLFYTPGIMRNDQSRDDFTFVYDLETKEKILKKKLESL